MKPITKLGLAAAVLGSLAFVGGALADDYTALSPKLKAALAQYNTGMGSTADPDLIHPVQAANGTPKVQSQRAATATASSAKQDPDLVRAQREIVYTGKTPTPDRQRQQFSLAPLK